MNSLEENDQIYMIILPIYSQSWRPFSNTESDQLNLQQGSNIETQRLTNKTHFFLYLVHLACSQHRACNHDKAPAPCSPSTPSPLSSSSSPADCLNKSVHNL